MIYKIGFVGLLLAGVLTGCMKDDTTVALGEGDVTIQIQLQTYAVNSDSNAAGDAELIVKSAYVFIFNEYGVLENAGKTAVGTPTATGEVIDSSGTLNASWKVYAGTKDVYVIANPGQELSGRLATMSATNGLDKATLEAVMTAEDKFLEDVAAFATKGMIMSGKTEAAPVSGSGTKITVPLKRRHARIDLHMRRAKDLEGAEVKVKGVKLKDQIRKTYAFESSSAASSTAYAEEKTLATNIATQQNTEGEWSATLTDYTSVTSFYSFERAVGGSVKAVCLEVTLTINGVDKMVPVYICLTAIGTDCTGNDENRPVKIEGNYVYRVLATLGRQSTDAALNIVDWADAPVAGDISGSEFDLPGRVELSKNNPTLAIDYSASQNVEFIGYECGGESFTDGSKLPAWLPKSNITGLSDNMGTVGNIDLTAVSDQADTPDVKLWFKTGNIKKSMTVAYRNYTLAVTAPADSYPYSGGSQSYKVTSFSMASGVQTDETWQTEYSIDNGATWTSNKPDYLTAFTSTDVGGAEKIYEATVAPQVGTNSTTETLKNNVSVFDYNLSNATGGDGVQNTANCYLVNAPGSYRLPLVYGNAIKNGADNTPAYNPQTTGTSALQTFKDHNDQNITSPYIYNKYTPADCCLVWQDAPNMLSRVKLSDDKRWLTFEVEQGTIHQGNAIVAVRDANKKILWSWHIWITTYRLGNDLKTIINQQAVTYKILPIRLGWCDRETYAARDMKVRITQPVSGLSAEFDINQTATVAEGSSLYYQFGRKDPLIAPNLIIGYGQSYDKPTYSDNPDYLYQTNPDLTQQVSIGYTIQHPNVCYVVNILPRYDWNQTNVANLWSAVDANCYTHYQNSYPHVDGVVVKTVYDPSPVGYTIPPTGAFGGFSLSDVVGTWNYGYTLDCNAGGTGDQLTFRTTGIRNYMDGKVGYLDRLGMLWTANAGDGWSNSSAYNFRIQDGSIKISNTTRSTGAPVQPVQEK